MNKQENGLAAWPQVTGKRDGKSSRLPLIYSFWVVGGLEGAGKEHASGKAKVFQDLNSKMRGPIHEKSEKSKACPH